MLKKMVGVRREYKVVYYNQDSKWSEYARIPWFRNAYTIHDARKIKRKLKDEGKIDVNILVYDTTMYKMR